MLYAILCYNSEEAIGAWSKEYHDETMTKLYAVNDKLARQGRLGPVARLLPTTAAWPSLASAWLASAAAS